jgi:alkylation response protein AidB-like acyl-CoA dehydrogenase
MTTTLLDIGSSTSFKFPPNVFVASNILGKLNHGAYVLMSGLNLERLAITAGPVG